jgi:chromosome segregation ATPase
MAICRTHPHMTFCECREKANQLHIAELRAENEKLKVVVHAQESKERDLQKVIADRDRALSEAAKREEELRQDKEAYMSAEKKKTLEWWEMKERIRFLEDGLRNSTLELKLYHERSPHDCDDTCGVKHGIKEAEKLLGDGGTAK